MNIDQIISVNIILWDRYFKKISKIVPDEGKILFPNIMLVTECEDFFIVELMGLTEKYQGLSIKKHRTDNVNSYLYHFNYGDYVPKKKNNNVINSMHFSGILFGPVIEDRILNERFFFHNRWETKFLTSQGEGAVNTIKFGDYVNFVEYQNCCLVNRLGVVYRTKAINYLHIVGNEIAKPKYKRFLIGELDGPVINSNDLRGALYSTSKNNNAELLYTQFLNVYSFNQLRETTIGEFLKNNITILESAFKSECVLYEPEFEWIEGNPDPEEKSINPDFLIKREDGYFDICDIKLPYWEKTKLTKGKRKRRSFKQIVDDAIAQLANYEDYFNFEKNQVLAKSKYDVEINKPNLIIIIGNLNNFEQKEIEEASRKLKPNFTIMDYDTLNLKYYNSKSSSTSG